MQIKDIFNHRNINIFVVIEDDYDNELNWTIEPTNHELIPAHEDHFFVKAFEVSQYTTSECYMEFKTPEQVTGIVVKENANGQPYVGNIYHQENTIIPAIACDFPGFYDIYSAKENPQIGIDVLRNGLQKATNKSAVAENLGCLLIDEERIDEAIEAFTISEKNTPTNQSTFFELAKLYAKRGEMDKSAEYTAKFKNKEK
jgi:tetratricopeptide (TPR) repeat protein